jgi:hypothetical protein
MRLSPNLHFMLLYDMLDPMHYAILENFRRGSAIFARAKARIAISIIRSGIDSKTQHMTESVIAHTRTNWRKRFDAYTRLHISSRRLGPPLIHFPNARHNGPYLTSQTIHRMAGGEILEEHVRKMRDLYTCTSRSTTLVPAPIDFKLDLRSEEM